MTLKVALQDCCRPKSDRIGVTQVQLALRVVLALLLLTLCYGARAQTAGEKMLAARFASQLERAEKGDLDSQLSVATSYQHGVGVEKNMTEAIRWYEAAAAQSSVDAMTELGSILHNKFAWDDESPEAADAVAQSIVWYERAARTGSAAAQNSLGLIYGFGDRVEIDRERGRMWLFVAEANGHPYQTTLVARMEEEISEDEVAAARSRADACITSDYADCE